MADSTSFMKSVAQGASDFVESIGRDVATNNLDLTKLRSNKAINPIGKFIFGESNTGIRGTLGSLAEGNGIKSSLNSAYRNVVKDEAGKVVSNNINWKAVGGTYVGAAAAGRVITGGGLYRDSTGKANLPVVPFI